MTKVSSTLPKHSLIHCYNRKLVGCPKNSKTLVNSSQRKQLPEPSVIVWSTSYKTERIFLGGWEASQPKPFVYTPPAEIRLLLAKGERWIFNNRGTILTLIIHWLGSPWFLPRCFEDTLANWSERLAKAPYQKNTPPAVRLEAEFLRMQI